MAARLDMFQYSVSPRGSERLQNFHQVKIVAARVLLHKPRHGTLQYNSSARARTDQMILEFSELTTMR